MTLQAIMAPPLVLCGVALYGFDAGIALGAGYLASDNDT